MVTSTVPVLLVSFEWTSKMYLPACQTWSQVVWKWRYQLLYINFYMDALEKVELIALIRHIERYLKSGIPIYNTEVPDTVGRKTGRRRRRRVQAIAKGYPFLVNIIIKLTIVLIRRLSESLMLFHKLVHVQSVS